MVETLTSAYEVWRAIHELRVRGAPAIGVAAAYGLCVAVQGSRHLPVDAFRAALEEQAAYLNGARPTAVNLSWSLKRMLRAAARVMAPAAPIAFSVETHDGDGAILRDTLRYAHGAAHVRASVDAAGLTLASLDSAATRTEKGVAVPGLIVVARIE